MEVGVKNVSALPASCSNNGVKSVSALLNGMQISYQAKAVDAVLTGKVTQVFLKITNIRIMETVMTNIRIVCKW